MRAGRLGGTRRDLSPVAFAVIALLMLVLLIRGIDASGAASRGLRVTVTPKEVAAGRAVTVKITGTRARQCLLTLRTDRYRAKPYMRRWVGRRSDLRIPLRSEPGQRILAVRCGRSHAYRAFLIVSPDPGLGPESEPPPPEEPPVDGGLFPEESPFPDETPYPEETPTPFPSPTPYGSEADTTPPSKPTGLTKAAATTSTITLSWKASTDNVRVAGYSTFRNGTRMTNLSATSYKFSGLTCGKSYQLAVEAYDAAVNVSSQAALTAATDACPPPPKKVAVARGGSAQGQPGCSVSSCRYIQVTHSGFSSATHTIVCRASGGDEGGFYSYTRTGASGASSVCYYGFPGRSVWATVDGVASPKITW